jgi:hypothetical protein
MTGDTNLDSIVMQIHCMQELLAFATLGRRFAAKQRGFQRKDAKSQRD